MFYEITFRIANDKISKFDRLIAFTKLEITDNYAARFAILAHAGLTHSERVLKKAHAGQTQTL